MKQILLERQGYSERIERMFGKGMVVALTGQRRVGKSCVMRRIYEKYSQDSHPKYVVSMDRMYGGTNVDGIRHLHLRDFLKQTSL